MKNSCFLKVFFNKTSKVIVGIIRGGKEFMKKIFQDVQKMCKEHKRKWIIIQLFLFSIGCLLVICLSKKEAVLASSDLLPILPEQFFIKEKQEEIEEKTYIKVDLKGSVINPGVYEMEEGDRIIDVIERCGGLKEEANTENVNLSKKLTDEMVIKIPNRNEKEENIKEETKDSDGKISLNKALLSELMEIPGIGEAKAKAIMEYRALHPFEVIEDVIEVDGIGEKLFEKIKEFIIP